MDSWDDDWDDDPDKIPTKRQLKKQAAALLRRMEKLRAEHPQPPQQRLEGIKDQLRASIRENGLNSPAGPTNDCKDIPD